jgi:hypothetical protein
MTHFLIASALAQSLGNGIGIMQGIFILAGMACLGGACLAAAHERGVTAIGFAVVAIIVLALSFNITDAAFGIGGSQVHLQQGNLN